LPSIAASDDIGAYVLGKACSYSSDLDTGGRAAVGMGIPMGFPWVWVWYGYVDCDKSPWVKW